MPGYYHNPPRASSTRPRCPVCNEPVYSRAGIHPQCAVHLSEPPRSKGGTKTSPTAAPIMNETVSQSELPSEAVDVDGSK